MTEPVPRAHTRRTVRMASALVAVQVALCAVIGFVTFGASHHGRSGHPAADSLAAAPRLIPPAFAAAPDPSAIEPSPGSLTKRINPKPSPPPATREAPTLAGPPPSPPAKSTDPALLRPAPGNSVTIAPSPRSTVPDTVLPTPSPTGSVQSGAVEDQTCSPLNALGRTRDGSVLICRPATDGSLHWKTS